jgi:hypothetical protein
MQRIYPDPPPRANWLFEALRRAQSSLKKTLASGASGNQFAL